MELAARRVRQPDEGSRRAKNWDGHVDNIERLAATPAFKDLRDRILERAQLRASDTLLDVGAGTGLLALAASPRVERVHALDVSPAMCRRLADKVRAGGLGNVDVLRNSATDLSLPHGAVDVVVSNYCFHHLSDAEKKRALAEIGRVLRPGGRLVFGDMMFRVSLANRRDRNVMLRAVRRILAHGPAGVARMARNAARLAAGRGEHPARIEWWREALRAAGFADVSVQALDHEGGIASARRPSFAPGAVAAAPPEGLVIDMRAFRTEANQLGAATVKKSRASGPSS